MGDSSLIPVLTLLSVVVLSLIVVRVASVALTLTGLSRELARFEARSAFTGTGFTSSDSEKVVGHPVRRRIIMWLMLLGNAGFVTVISSLIWSMMGTEEAGGSLWFRLLLLLTGLVLLWFLAHSQWVDRWMCRIIEVALRRFTSIDLTDYVDLLHVGGDYAVIEVAVKPGSWLDGRSLMELHLTAEGVVVLGIERHDGTYIGTPFREAKLHARESIVMYGPRDVLTDLDSRPSGAEGEAAHRQFVAAEHERNAALHAQQLQ